MVESKIRTIVSDLLSGDLDSPEIDSTASLRELGITSIDKVKILLNIEKEFNIKVPSAQINDENFLSVKSLSGMVESNLKNGSP